MLSRSTCEGKGKEMSGERERKGMEAPRGDVGKRVDSLNRKRHLWEERTEGEGDPREGRMVPHSDG